MIRRTRTIGWALRWSRRAEMVGTLMLLALLAVTVPHPTELVAQDVAPEPLELTLETMNQNVSVSGVEFSPDGDALLVRSDRSGQNKLWLMDPNGENSRLLVDDDGSEGASVWSPDGTRIAFIRSGEDGPDLWTVGRDGSQLSRVTEEGESIRAPIWSPDGHHIAFISDRAGDQDIWIVNMGTGQTTQLTFGTNPWDEGRWAPTWSPDSRQIAYVSNRSGEMVDDLWLVDVASAESRKLTANVWVMSNPIWSPDGDHIAFTGMAHHEFWYGDQSDIYVVEMPDARLRRVDMNTFVSDGNGGVQLQWHPNAEELFFRLEWEGDSNLWRVPVDGGVATKITYDEGGFRNFSVAGDGSAVAYVRQTPVHPGEVHVVSLDGGPARQVTNWVHPYQGVEAPRKITYRARDGHQILGYLFLPPDFDPATRYPALVQAHGGGNNAFGNGFHALEHLLAQEGFVVMAIEYRGSSGHGREFQDLALGAWAADQGWDGVDAAEYLRSLPYTLDSGVGMYGGSYGGIMTMASLTRDAEPFAAAAPLYGIFDWASAYEHGDRLMQFWIVQGHEGFKPGEHPDLFEYTATLRNLDGLPTDLPFLVIHGELDRRAPFQQSEDLRDALRARGNPVEFHSYPNEYHGFRMQDNREHAYGRMIEFFKEQVGTPTGGPR